MTGHESVQTMAISRCDSCAPKMTRYVGPTLGTSPPLTEVSRALRARNAERVSKMSPGAGGPGTPKSLKKVSGTVREVSGESPESVWRVFLECSGTFWTLLGVPGPEAPGDIFETLWAFRARRARETSVRGGLVPKANVHSVDRWYHAKLGDAQLPAKRCGKILGKKKTAYTATPPCSSAELP